MVAAAGYTRGAFYSNFQSKEDLFLELLRRDHAATHAEFGAHSGSNGFQNMRPSMYSIR